MINEVKKDLMQVSGLNSGVLLVSLTDIEIILNLVDTMSWINPR